MKKGSCSCQSILPIISRANAIAAVGNGLQLNTTPHHPSIFLLPGNERKAGFADLCHPGLTRSRLSPWPSGHEVRLSSPKQHRVPTYSAITH